MYKTLLVNNINFGITVTIHRPEQKNSINNLLLQEIEDVLNEAEHNSKCRFIILQGENGIFCTGMDFKELTENLATLSGPQEMFSSNYMAVLKRFTTTSKIIVSLLDGQVLAGGVGFVAASDLVLSTHRTQFGLSEALWGLLPACVTPFLIRRVGFQKAYIMTLTTETMDSTKAHAIGLIDELTDNFQESLRRLIIRLSRLEEQTIQDLKSYFRKMWIIDEAMEKTAVAEITRLVNKPLVHQNIKNFVEQQKLPWEQV